MWDCQDFSFHFSFFHITSVMGRIFRQTKTVLLTDAIILLICLMGIYRAAEKAWLPVDLEQRAGEIEVAGQRAEYKLQPFRKGDVLLKLNTISVRRIEDIEYICDGFRVGDSVSVKLVRAGNHLSVKAALTRYYSLSFIILMSIVGALFFVLGLFVFLKLSDKHEAHVYHWLSIGIALINTTTWGRFTTLPFGLEHLMRIAYSGAYAFVPALFVHFSYVFPVGKKKPFSQFMRLLYLLSAFLALWQVGTFLLSIKIFSIARFHHFLLALNVTRWFFALCIIFGIGNFFHSYFHAKEEIDRRKLRWILLGLSIGPLVYVILWQIPQALVSKGLISEQAVLLALAVAPITFTIAILRYRLLDIDLIFRRSSIYFFTIAALMIVYALIVGALAALVAEWGVFSLRASLMASAFAAVISALLFEPLRKRVQHFVDKKFFRVRYDYRIAQNRFTARINQFYDVEQMAAFTVQELENLLHPRCIAFYLYSEEDKQWQIIARNNWRYAKSNLIHELAKQDYHASQIIALPEFVESAIYFKEADRQLFEESKIALAVVCKDQHKEAGAFIILGRKKATPVFSQEDIDLLRTIALQIGLAIERIRLQQNLIMQFAETRRLDELNRLKSYFVSSVSHELQSPLTSIKMFAELLKSKKNLAEKEKREYLEIIEGESDRLTRLINNVLNFSRMERGVKEYHFSEMNLIEVIEKVVQAMKYQLKQHGFKIDLNFAQAEIMLPADKDAIYEALVNLISNAVKYSQSEKIVSISAAVEKGQAKIAVADRGVGIPAAEQKKIFDTFYRSKDKYIRSSGGAGLGLTIVRHIVEAHQGSIKLQSKPGQGSTFIIYLPLGKSE